MKNFEATRGKMKNYLQALKERFSSSEWKEYRSNELCKEFGVSVTTPQILKKEGYYFYEIKAGVPLIMLSQKIMTLSEVTLHNKVREYCKQSYERQAIKQIQKKAKNKFNKKLLEEKSINKVKYNNLSAYKNLTIKVGKDFYEKILIDCEKNNISVAQWIASKLVFNDKEFITDYDYNKILKPTKKIGRPLKKKFDYDFKNETPKQERVSIKTIEPIESAQTKIKSLETIMSLFVEGVINKDELESLKKGVLAK